MSENRHAAGVKTAGVSMGGKFANQRRSEAAGVGLLLDRETTYTELRGAFDALPEDHYLSSGLDVFSRTPGHPEYFERFRQFIIDESNARPDVASQKETLLTEVKLSSEASEIVHAVPERGDRWDYEHGYADTALALGRSEDGDVPLDDDFDVDDIADDTRIQMREDLAQFVLQNQVLVNQYLERAEHPTRGEAYRQLGYDFYLTRNHHGAGFWDRGLGDLGQDLTQAAHDFCEFDLHVGDDGKLHGTS